MAENIDPLDRLVAGLSADDRNALLQRLKVDIDPEKQDLLVDENIVETGSTNFEKALKTEPFFLKIKLFFKSLFSSTPIAQTYSEYRILALAKKIDNKYPDLLNPRDFSLANNFYEHLIELKQVNAFFKSGILEYEEEEGKFFVLLGSLIMPNLGELINKNASPYSLPPTQEVTADLRASLIRKMEIILGEIPQEDKTTLYACVQYLGWLKQFLRLPYDNFLQKFTPGADGKVHCPMRLALPEITQFANILCNGKKIHPEALQALYMFQAQARITAGEAVNIQTESSLYFEKSMANLALIKQFINKVPMRSISAIANNSCSWLPTYKEGCEDWFVRYKAQWRKIFDQKWELWLHDQKLAKTKKMVTTLFQTPDYPLIPNRPWEVMDENIHCSKKYSLGFLYAFFNILYPKHTDTLKILLVDGDFILRENRVEFTDAYTEMNHLSEIINELNVKLSNNGVYGEAFNEDNNELLRTIQGQAKIQSYMHSIEAEAGFIIMSFANQCRALIAIFDGILVDKRNPRYDGITNIAILLGSDNVPIRKHLVDASQCISDTFELVKELEMIELNSPI